MPVAGAPRDPLLRQQCAVLSVSAAEVYGKEVLEDWLPVRSPVRLAWKLVLLVRKHLLAQTRRLGDSPGNALDERNYGIAKYYI